MSDVSVCGENSGLDDLLILTPTGRQESGRSGFASK